MEISAAAPRQPLKPEKPDVERIKQKLLKSGVAPTPKIIHNICRKHRQKVNRREAKLAAKEPPPLTHAQKQTLAEEFHFQTIQSEYRSFVGALNAENERKLIGRPWERLDKLQLQVLSRENTQYSGNNLRGAPLRELCDIIECEREKYKWILDDDVEIEEGWSDNRRSNWVPPKLKGGESEAIQFLMDKLSGTEMSVKNYKFSRLMKYSGLQFTERQMLRLVEGLGERGEWRHALSIVKWVYGSKEHVLSKSRFVYTKLLAVLGRCRRPHEALEVFDLMRRDAQIFPDMAAYHSMCVLLGQAGLLKELINIIDCMKEKPKKIKTLWRKNWDPIILPDIVIYNAVLNACVPSCQWKGVYWVFQQLRNNDLEPNAATYGLAMEVMLQSRKYDQVHELFEKMKRSGFADKAITYKVLVKTLWEEGKVNEAIQAVREMEERGILGTPCVYYELACCLCYHGMLDDAFFEIEKLKRLRLDRPLTATFTGMILSSMEGGHIENCISIYKHCKKSCEPDIGIMNAMLKVYSRNDMFLEAKELYESTKSSLGPDNHTFSSMLEASAQSLQWEYFESVYKEMALVGHQLDAEKHANLLVDASKAGKGHLLDHAFDLILEGGRVPPASFFTEIICDATSRCDYGRAAAVLNMLALAPYQITEQEWTEVFDGRVESGSFQDLVHGLRSRTEASILNLCRALDSGMEEGVANLVQGDCSSEFEEVTTSENEDWEETDEPSAYEILQQWKETEESGDISSPFL